MSTEIIVNATMEETRVALLENGQVTELYIDRKKDASIVGNVYKGKVVKVLPGMQSAFVDIGFEKAAFLFVSDVTNNLDEYAHLMEEESQQKLESTLTDSFPPFSIEDLLQEGQDVVVQVSKEPIGTKGARVTSYITLPGRYLVYMPGVEHIGVSRKIADDRERERLRSIISKIKRPNAGYIVRTVSEGRNEEDFTADMEFLELLWGNIQKKRERISAPALLHSDLDLLFKTIRDLFSQDVKRMIIDNREEYKRAIDFANTYLPSLTTKIELYEREEPIFDAYGIEIEISRALGRRVWLKSGGYIVIEQTEALTAIDVNTGRYVGKRDFDETILKTNLEAVKEIAYQLRLRNIGGIIIIDFIDMEREEDRKKVYVALQEALSNDKAKSSIFQISELGLIEMTRKRVRDSLGRILCEPCPYCDGRGHIKSPTTVCYEIFREIRRSTKMRGKNIFVTVNPSVADLLYDEERQEIEDIERESGAKIIVKADGNIHQEQFDIAI